MDEISRIVLGVYYSKRPPIETVGHNNRVVLTVEIPIDLLKKAEAEHSKEWEGATDDGSFR